MTSTFLLLMMIVGCWANPITRFDQSEKYKRDNDDDNIITPPVLPVIEHLENDPTTLTREEKKLNRLKLVDRPKTRLGLGNSFGVNQDKDGGFTASLSHGFGGGTGAFSHSLNVSPPGKGFQVSQSSSQSSSFGGGMGFFGPSLSGSQSSSQSSSFSGGLQGISSSGASSSSISGNIFGNGFSGSNAQSQSGANSFGSNGISSAFGQGSGQAISFPGGQTIANGQSSSGAFGNGAFGAGSGSGFAQNGNGFSGTGANSQSIASVQAGGGSLTGFGQSTGFGGNTFSQQSNRRNPIASVFTFPKTFVDRPKVTTWSQPYNRIGKTPSEYQIIRVEV